MPELQEFARTALLEVTAESTVGAFVSETAAGEDVTTYRFETTLLGYPGWNWSITIAHLPGDEPTVVESELLPAEGALLAPDWVPWSERMEEYRAAQAAAAEAGEAVEVPGDDADGTDAEDDDDLDDDDLDVDDDEDDEDAYGSDVLHSGDLDGVDIDELDGEGNPAEGLDDATAEAEAEVEEPTPAPRRRHRRAQLG